MSEPISSAVLRAPRDLRLLHLRGRDPGAMDLVVRPDAVGICATDVELFEGTMAYLATGFARYPVVPGHEWTGIVTAVGARVEGFRPGDRVVGECSVGCGDCARCTGGDYHLCPSRTETGIARRDGALTTRMIVLARAAHRVPPHVDRRDAALIEPLAVAVRALGRAGVRPGDEVGVVGSGSIGLLTAMTADAIGAVPRLVDADPARVAFARTLGFHADTRPGGPAPRVIEASGTAGGVRTAIASAGDGGTIVVVGLAGQALPVDLDEVVLRDLRLVGSLGSPNHWPEAIDLVARGRVSPARIVSHEFGLDAVAGAYALAGRRDPSTRKVLIDPSASLDRKAAIP